MGAPLEREAACMPLSKFIRGWNRFFPKIDDFDEDIAGLRAHTKEEGETDLEARMLARLEEERAGAIAEMGEDPGAFERAQAFRIVIPVTRRSDFGEDLEIGFRFLDWLIRSWAPTWIDWLEPRTGGRSSGSIHAGKIRLIDTIDTYESLLRAVQTILDFADDAADEAGDNPFDDYRFIEAFRASGWAAVEEVISDCNVMDSATEALVDRLWDGVASLAIIASTHSPIDNFDGVVEAQRLSAMAMLREVAAEGGKNLVPDAVEAIDDDRR